MSTTINDITLNDEEIQTLRWVEARGKSPQLGMFDHHRCIVELKQCGLIKRVQLRSYSYHTMTQKGQRWLDNAPI